MQASALVLVFTCLCIANTHADELKNLQNKEETFFMPSPPGMGTTVPSCGSFLASVDGLKIGTYKQFSLDGEVFYDKASLLRNWISGYISGINLLEKSLYNKQAKAEYVDIEVWLRGYCKLHPTTNIIIAVNDFISENIK